MRRLVIGSRASRLARTQTEDVIRELRQADPRVQIVHHTVSTTGDKDRVSSLAALGGAGGVFTKELEIPLLAGEVDLAVHSLKDVPTVLPEGLCLAATPRREEVRDALCGARLDDLPSGARVGTGSPRRRAQLLRARPDLQVVALRGNVPTRLAEVQEGRVDAVVLAAAGLGRLALAHEITELLPLDRFLPAPAQGALGLEHRQDDRKVARLCAAIGDPEAEIAVAAERAVLARVEGGCSAPIGAFGDVADGSLSLTAEILSLDGQTSVRESVYGPQDDWQRLARALADGLLAAGGAAIMADLRQA